MNSKISLELLGIFFKKKQKRININTLIFLGVLPLKGYVKNHIF